MAGRRGRMKGTFDLTPRPPPPVHNFDQRTTFDYNGTTYELDASQMDRIGFIGQGVHGTVEKMLHRPSNIVMAVKQIGVSLNSNGEQNTFRELDVSMRAANCPNVVHFYGALFREGSIWMCIELMDTSLELFYKKVYACGRTIPEDVLGVIALSILEALRYLHVELKVIHRDVKPSNILVNRNGAVKICDFGISGRLVDSMAKSQVGCQLYMAPERVVVEPGTKGFDVRADVWSFGITMIEVATGKFPYDKWTTVFQQIKQVVEEDPPRLPANLYSEDFCSLIENCLQKDVKSRLKYAELMNTPFIMRCVEAHYDIAPFVTEILDSPLPASTPSEH